jgi:hypothetical protein
VSRKGKGDALMPIRQFAILSLIIITIATFISCSDNSPGFTGPWIGDSNIGIARALIKNGVKGCGEYNYRKSLKFTEEYQVRCVGMNNKVTYYLVHPNVNGVAGPFAAPYE